ncbi:MAG: hypothetical protein WD768_01115, partial [Phycisphaeraceae bacterium]
MSNEGRDHSLFSQHQPPAPAGGGSFGHCVARQASPLNTLAARYHHSHVALALHFCRDRFA